MEPDEYCREIEAYLCRKNDGHLIRIVGPSFERVRGWASQGIPFKVACQGIDRYFTRYYAKGVRRRPVQIDFCEADVLDAFDAWRRAVGVPGEGVDTIDEPAPKRPHRSLPEHLLRVCERLTARLTARVPPPADLFRVLEQAAGELSSFADLPGPIRGDERARVCRRLAELDRMMLDAARQSADESALQTLRAEAAAELAGFRDRMPAGEYTRALEAAVDRLLRERGQLPTVAFE